MEGKGGAVQRVPMKVQRKVGSEAGAQRGVLTEIVPCLFFWEHYSPKYFFIIFFPKDRVVRSIPISVLFFFPKKRLSEIVPIFFKSDTI